MGYADLSSAKAQLSLDDENPDDAADIALLIECDDAVAVLFEQKAGYDITRTPIWGDDADASATLRTLDGEPGNTDILLLPIPARSVSSVAVVGEVPETIAGSQWILWHVSTKGDALAIRRIDGYGWPWVDGRTRIEVTAVWADGPIGGNPPSIVVSACTFVTVDEFRMRKTSPNGVIGLEGLTVRPRNPWGFDVVKAAIEAVRAASPMVVF